MRRATKSPAINRCPWRTVAVALFVLQMGCDRPSKEEIKAYRNGYGIGKTVRQYGGNESQIPSMAGQMPPDHIPFYKKGAEDGVKGREARYDYPN